ncbi:MAG: AAA domain-containing protein [Ruminococcus flavefaciens]|nr:AAA domain-containing protein [Ruminococcus flavefaciens]
MIRSLKLCRKDGKKPSYAKAVELTKQLSDCQQRMAQYQEAEAPFREVFGSAYRGIQTDWSYVAGQMEIIRAVFAEGNSFGRLAEGHDLAGERTMFEGYAVRLDECLAKCTDETIDHLTDCFDNTIWNIKRSGLVLTLTRCKKCLNGFDQLEHWQYFSSLLSRLNDYQMMPFVDTAIQRCVEAKYIPGVFKKQFYNQWIESILSATPALSKYDRIAQDKVVRIFAEKDVEQFEINKAKIRSVLSAERPSLDMIASGSALAVLLREGEKKRKQKSIRSLLAETGELVQRIKPCFLMSPLSVSTFLTSGSIRFDVVVFDEASQIFPQDAIGAIYRARQLIVVGDSRQMPPSNFFNATIEAEDNDEETGDVTDFESVLDLCSTSMQQLRLRWHYRSRYEQLIVFSNKNFYDNDLVTFPSSRADTVGIGVDYYHVEGIFDRKSHTNQKEAEYIVDLIYQNIKNYPNRSLGVVAFSVAQQDLIDKLLSKRRQSMPETEYFFKRQGEEPFFIKNLETVQGDERDTIIFSVAYGKDEQGRLLHNFGPLNRIGGERRLNVAVTRARYNIQLVSSMHCTDIDLKRTSALGVTLLREYLDFAENGNIALEHAMSVSPYEQFDSDFELEVCEFLGSKGFSVDTQIGCSGFRIDLGLKIPNSSDYALAIECDGAAYHSSKNARDRDRLRQEVLERMGWRFYRIWSTDWFRSKAVEQRRLLEAAAKAVQNPVKKKTETSDIVEAESFEIAAAKKHFEFPRYKAANLAQLNWQYFRDLKGMVKAILEIEAPLSEELLLKRIVGYFGREKVTSFVQQEYEQQMYGYQLCGIIRRNGFLYLKEPSEIIFRGPGDIVRDIRQIAPEELAAGMLEILRQNVTADRNGLYRSLALQCGVTRLTKTSSEYFDIALQLLADSVVVEGEMISLK